MKKIYFTLLLIVAFSTAGLAQNSDTKKADKYYNRFDYAKAVKAYEKLVEKDKADLYVYTMLANSYYYMNDTQNAEKYYKMAVQNEEVEPSAVYNYVQSLRTNGKYDQAKTWMARFADMNPSDSRAKEFKKSPNYVSLLKNKPESYTVTNLKSLNSEYSDFGVREYGNQVYFSSARNTSRRDYGRNDEPFLDIFQTTLVNDEASDIKRVKGDVNTKFHEGTMAVTSDGTRMYFDRNDYYDGKYEKDEEGVNQLKIFYATLVEGEWIDVQPVPFNNSEYSVGHPALSPDSETLYFVSDMPGSVGESDIYRVSIDGDGNFGEPKNLGNTVNTEGKEVFPFIANDGTLYFSSNGHLGLGGLDVFYAKSKGNSFGDVENAGVPINSADDDFSFSINDDTMEGFVASDRAGNDDIYRVKEMVCETQLDAIVLNAETNEPISEAVLKLYDTDKNQLAMENSSEQGATQFGDVECKKSYVVHASKENFEPNSKKVMLADDNNPQVKILLTPIKEDIIKEDRIVLGPILFDFDKHNIKPKAAFELDKVVGVMKKYPKMIVKVKSHTDNRGNDAYNKKLSEERAQSTVDYIVSKGIDKSRISGKGYGEEEPLIDCKSNCTEKEFQKNRRSEFIIVKR